jgi:hypothetical protein
LSPRFVTQPIQKRLEPTLLSVLAGIKTLEEKFGIKREDARPRPKRRAA